MDLSFNPSSPVLLLLVFLPLAVYAAVPKFEPVSLTNSSFVIRLVNGENVSHLDMAVHIFDLDRLVEFRKTEFKSNDRDELFSFDGLTPSTWFAFRIHYRVIFTNTSAEPGHDFVTKQELVVRTKSDGSSLPPSTIEDVVSSIEETFITRDALYVSVMSIFGENKKVMTVVVPELRCPGRGVVKPLAQQIVVHARFHFDVSQLGEDAEAIECDSVCLYPFLRVSIVNRTSETFRAREWCGSISRVIELGSMTNAHTTSAFVAPLLALLFILLR